MFEPRRLAVTCLAGMALGGCGPKDESGPSSDERPETAGRFGVLDEHAASYRGVGLGDPPHKITEVFGRPGPRSRTGSTVPLGEEDRETGLPQVVAPPPRFKSVRQLRRGLHRYRGATFEAIEGAGVYFFSVTAAGTRTRRGVGIGDPLDGVKRRYPQLRCGIRDKRSEYPAYPYCAGKLGKGRYIWFGEDPVRSISMAIRAMG